MRCKLEEEIRDFIKERDKTFKISLEKTKNIIETKEEQSLDTKISFLETETKKAIEGYNILGNIYTKVLKECDSPQSLLNNPIIHNRLMDIYSATDLTCSNNHIRIMFNYKNANLEKIKNKINKKKISFPAYEFKMIDFTFNTSDIENTREMINKIEAKKVKIESSLFTFFLKERLEEIKNEIEQYQRKPIGMIISPTPFGLDIRNYISLLKHPLCDYIKAIKYIRENIRDLSNYEKNKPNNLLKDNIIHLITQSNNLPGYE
jgi:hypothetical protein